MINRYKPHIIIVPEDDANRQIANGFCNMSDGAIDIYNYPGGKFKVLNAFSSDLIATMQKFREARVVLLTDFDEDITWLQKAIAKIPEELRDRVLVLGVWSEPEKLKASVGRLGLEKIGGNLAKDCQENTQTHWSHDLLKHNLDVLKDRHLELRAICFKS